MENEDIIHYCCYGCGNVARYFSKRTGKWRCFEKSPTSCPALNKLKSAALKASYEQGTLVSPLKGTTLSQENKDKISNSVKEYFKKYPERHPWSKGYHATKSPPCEHFKQILKENGIVFLEEYRNIVPKRRFKIDIAFPDIKLGIEINGGQHYTDGTYTILDDYFQERHDLIVQQGWELIEVPYMLVFDDLYVGKLLFSIKNKTKFVNSYTVYAQPSEFFV